MMNLKKNSVTHCILARYLCCNCPLFAKNLGSYILAVKFGYKVIVIDFNTWIIMQFDIIYGNACIRD